MRRYVIYAALMLAALVMLNLLAPLVVFGSEALVRDPNLSVFNVPAQKEAVRAAQPAALSVNASRGQFVYRTYCYGCHAPEAKFGPIQSSAEFQAKYANDSAIVPVIRGGRAPMPSFPDHTLSDADLADLIAYLRTLK
ncbi:MAG: cytochrome c [Chloroflexi bacterium]|nr:cytochrome c [Chloroflexota bacterium]